MKYFVPSMVVLLTFYSIGSAEIKTKNIDYKAGDTNCKGFLAYDDATSGKKPAVLIVHEWWGNNDYIHHRAEQIAALGYVSFAVDMYGDGQTTTDPKIAGQWAGKVKGDPKILLERAQAGLDTLKAQDQVDGSKIAAIGYCFGGTCVLQMARSNKPILGVVSFHGGLDGGIPAASITPKILVCTGADDQFVPPTQVQAFEDEMRKAGADWQVIDYSGAHHAFTNPDADKFGIPNISYNKNADMRSWQAMQDFFKELFAK